MLNFGLRLYPSYMVGYITGMTKFCKYALSPIHTSCAVLKEDHRRPKKQQIDHATDGETSLTVDHKKENVFVDANTPDLLFGGVRYADLPICYIKATKNNTIFSISHSGCKTHMIRSCGYDGFKNSKKGTSVAAQTTGISFGLRAVEKGMTNIRVCVQGIGPGRMSSLQGLTHGGLSIVSITDATRVKWAFFRGRKVRRL